MKVKKEASQPEDGNPIVLELVTEDGETIEMEVVCPICDHRGFWLSEDRTLMYCSKCGASFAKRKMDVLPSWEVEWRV